MLRNFVAETANAPGQAQVVNLAGPMPGRVAFLAAFPSGSLAFYYMDDGAQDEAGFGTVTAGSPDTISRDFVLWTSAAQRNNPTRLNFTGSVKIYNEVPAEKAIYADANGDVAVPRDLNAGRDVNAAGNVGGQIFLAGKSGGFAFTAGVSSGYFYGNSAALAARVPVGGRFYAQDTNANAVPLVIAAAADDSCAVQQGQHFFGLYDIGDGAGSYFGYTKGPNSSIRQFGYIGGARNTNGYVTNIQFPTAFPNRVLAITTMITGAGGPTPVTIASTANGNASFDVVTTDCTTGAAKPYVGFWWIAEGD